MLAAFAALWMVAWGVRAQEGAAHGNGFESRAEKRADARTAIPRANWRRGDREYRVILVATRTFRPGDQQTFFLDLGRLGVLLGQPVDTESIQVCTETASDNVPFSLDWRYGDREPGLEEYVRPVTGYNGEKYPLAEGRLRRLGYVSFRAAVGETRYHLYFDLAPVDRGLRDRPVPALRPWWIETLADPDFQVDNNSDGKPDHYVWVAKGDSKSTWGIAPRPEFAGRNCLKLTSAGEGTLTGRSGCCAFDQRASGRRVILYQQLFAEQGIQGQRISVSLPNAYRPESRASAALYYFGEIPARQWYEMAVEGRVRAGIHLAGCGMHHTYNGPCHVGETHVQFPPELPACNTIGLETDVACPGDEIGLTWQSKASESFYPMKLSLGSKEGRHWTVEGQRVEQWTEGFSLVASLADPSGKPVAELRDTARVGQPWQGTLRVPASARGRYRLSFQAISRREIPETVAHLESDVRILAGPFEQ